MRYEVRDVQTLAGKLVDDGVADPRAIGATGISYGGGNSMMLAFLRNRIRTADGGYAPWRSPKGTPISLAAAWPRWGWTNGESIFTRNGRGPWSRTPVGVEAQAYAGAIFAVAFGGFVAPTGGELSADLTLWKQQLDAGAVGPAHPGRRSTNTYRFHGVAGVTGRPAPLLVQSGWTDALFPVRRRSAATTPCCAATRAPASRCRWATSGTRPAANHPADTQAFDRGGRTFFDAWLRGRGAKPRPGSVTAYTMTCPASAPAGGGPYRATRFGRLARGLLALAGRRALRIDATGGERPARRRGEPAGRLAVRAARPRPDEPRGLSRRSPGVTLIGLPVITGRVDGEGPLRPARRARVGPRPGHGPAGARHARGLPAGARAEGPLPLRAGRQRVAVRPRPPDRRRAPRARRADLRGQPGAVQRHAAARPRGAAGARAAQPPAGDHGAVGVVRARSASTALLVMDVQRGIAARLDDGGAAVVARVAAAVEVARTAGLRVVFVRVGFRPGHPEVSPRNRAFAALRDAGGLADEAATAIDPRAAPRPDEAVVTKRRVSAFAGSDLEVVLRAGAVEDLVLCGIATGGVVLSTLRAAADLDFGLTVLHDACADADDEVHRVLTTKVFPRQADVLDVATWTERLDGAAGDAAVVARALGARRAGRDRLLPGRVRRRRRLPGGRHRRARGRGGPALRRRCHVLGRRRGARAAELQPRDGGREHGAAAPRRRRPRRRSRRAPWRPGRPRCPRWPTSTAGAWGASRTPSATTGRSGAPLVPGRRPAAALTADRPRAAAVAAPAPLSSAQLAASVRSRPGSGAAVGRARRAGKRTRHARSSSQSFRRSAARLLRTVTTGVCANSDCSSWAARRR